METDTRFKVGDVIVYGSEGCCRVEAVGPASFGGGEDRLYYTLSPLYREGRIYAPVDVQVRMRPSMTREQALELLCGIPDMDEEKAPALNRKELESLYREQILSCDQRVLLRLIRSIYFKNQEAIRTGKNYTYTDERYFKRARELFFGELAAALSIRPEEVEETIARVVEGERARRGQKNDG